MIVAASRDQAEISCARSRATSGAQRRSGAAEGGPARGPRRAHRPADSGFGERLRHPRWPDGGIHRDGAHKYVRGDGFAWHEWSLNPGDSINDLALLKSCNPAMGPPALLDDPALPAPQAEARGRRKAGRRLRAGEQRTRPKCRRRRKHEASGNQRQSGESCGASPGVRVLGEPWVQLQPSDRVAMAIERSRG